MKLEQIQADIALCKEKIIKALEVDCYSVLPIYVELITTLKKELDNLGSTYNIGKGVQQSAIKKAPNFTTMETIMNNPLKEGNYCIDIQFNMFTATKFFEEILKEYPHSVAVASPNSNTTILTILR
jgi:hypothetical protein